MPVWIIETDETVEEIAERIARARYEDPCTGWEAPFCNEHLHDWDTAHSEDKEYATAHARLLLEALGIG